MKERSTGLEGRSFLQAQGVSSNGYKPTMAISLLLFAYDGACGQ